MKKILSAFLLPVLAGCLTSTPPSVSYWPLEYRSAAKSAAAAKYDVARVSQVLVRTPYNSEGITVLRANGSLAFDSYNAFAAQPSALLKGVLMECLQTSGLFKSVVNASSSVHSSVNVELFVTRLALDCRTEGSRRAVAEVLVRVIGESGDMKIAKGAGEVDAADGNYGAAFSKAVTAALDAALGELR